MVSGLLLFVGQGCFSGVEEDWIFVVLDRGTGRLAFMFNGDEDLGWLHWCCGVGERR